MRLVAQEFFQAAPIALDVTFGPFNKGDVIESFSVVGSFNGKIEMRVTPSLVSDVARFKSLPVFSNPTTGGHVAINFVLPIEAVLLTNDRFVVNLVLTGAGTFCGSVWVKVWDRIALAATHPMARSSGREARF